MKSSLPIWIKLSLALRIMIGIYILNSEIGIAHGYLVDNNILISTCDQEYVIYHLKDKEPIKVPTYGIKPMIIDFGRSCDLNEDLSIIYDFDKEDNPLFIYDIINIMSIIEGWDLRYVSERTSNDLTFRFIQNYQKALSKKQQSTFWNFGKSFRKLFN
jgi:hypothetical protein